MGRAHFGRGIGPIALDNVGCNSTEMLLLQCHHGKLFTHNCRHSEDAGVICKDEHRLMSVNATVITDQGATITVLVAWELTNDTLDDPSFFEIHCFNERRHVMVTENNKTFVTQLELGGPIDRDLLSSPDLYNCCVLAIYNTLQPATPATKLCTQIDLKIYSLLTPEITVPSSTIMSSDSAQKFEKCSVSAHSAGLLGGVLGSIIAVLLLLLCVTLMCLVMQAKQNKRKYPAAQLRYHKELI